MDIVILIIIVLVCIFCVYQIFLRNMYPGKETYGNYCADCHGKTINKCMQCMNCGYLVSDNDNIYGRCVEGDMYGPYHQDPKGSRWIYNDPFWTDVLVSDSIVHPATVNYPNRYSMYNKTKKYNYLR